MDVRRLDLELKWVPFWVHFFNVPLYCFNCIMAKKICNAVRIFYEFDNSQVSSKRGSLRVQIKIDISKPIQCGIKINLEGPMDGSWIQMRYERLPDQCSFCGIIGHNFKDCKTCYKKDLKEENPHQYDYLLKCSKRPPIYNSPLKTLSAKLGATPSTGIKDKRIS